MESIIGFHQSFGSLVYSSITDSRLCQFGIKAKLNSSCRKDPILPEFLFHLHPSPLSPKSILHTQPKIPRATKSLPSETRALQTQTPSPRPATVKPKPPSQTEPITLHQNKQPRPPSPNRRLSIFQNPKPSPTSRTQPNPYPPPSNSIPSIPRPNLSNPQTEQKKERGRETNRDREKEQRSKRVPSTNSWSHSCQHRCSPISMWEVDLPSSISLLCTSNEESEVRSPQKTCRFSLHHHQRRSLASTKITIIFDFSPQTKGKSPKPPFIFFLAQSPTQGR